MTHLAGLMTKEPTSAVVAPAAGGEAHVAPTPAPAAVLTGSAEGRGDNMQGGIVESSHG